MADRFPLIVVVTKSEPETYGELLGRCRIWLDEHQIVPASFKPIAPGQGRGFEVDFKTVEDAARFRCVFGSEPALLR